MTKDKTVTMSRELAERLCKDYTGRPNWDALDDDRLAAVEELRVFLAASDMSDRIKSAVCVKCSSKPCICAQIAAPVVERQEPVGEVADMKYNRVQFYRATGDTSKPYLVPGTKLYTSPPAPVAVVPDKYDYDLLPFVALMRKELHANAGKGDRAGWLEMSTDTALLEIIYHFGKLQASVKRGDEDGIREYAADVANMCMMLVDICACLDKVKELNQ